MFELDPLFTRTFLLALPLRDIATVLQRDVHIPLHEVAWTVTRVAEESLPDKEVVVYLSISLNRRFLSRQHHLPHGCNRITLLRHLSAKEVLKLYVVKGSSIWPICVPLTLFDKMKKGKKGLFSMGVFSFLVSGITSPSA